jgi:hypothetical protein
MTAPIEVSAGALKTALDAALAVVGGKAPRSVR